MKKNLVDKPLTEMQKKYAKLYVEAKSGSKHLTNTEVAIQVGYAAESAYQRAHELLNPKLCPHVVKYISDLKDDFRRKNNIDPDKHMGRLHHLGLKAEENKMYGIAGQMEIARGKVAGYYVEKKMSLHKNVEDQTEEELEEKMKNILKDYEHILEDKNDKKGNGKNDK